MSETTTESVSSSTQGSQGATTEPKTNAAGAQRRPAVPGTSTGSGKGKSVASQSTDAAKNAQGKDAASGVELTRPTFELPEDLDLDSLDEEQLRRLSTWKKKAKINGKEEAIGFKDIFSYTQKEMAADQKMKKASEIERQFNYIVKALKENPEQVLEELGHNVDERAKNRIAQRLHIEAMSAEQRDAYEARQEAEKYKQQLLAQEQERTQQWETKAKDFAHQKWQTSMVSALEKSGLPPDPLTLKLTAQFVLANRQAGYKDFTAEDAIPMVKDFCAQMARYYFKSIPMPSLFKELGDEFDTNVRKFLLQKAENPIKETFRDAPSGQFKSENPGVTKDTRGKPMSPDEFKAQLDKKFG